jgi:hypothetical protein
MSKKIENIENSIGLMTRFFDSVIRLNEKFGENQTTIFIWGALVTTFAAPYIDEWLDWNFFTPITTILFTLFVLIIVLAWIGGWREYDDDGNSKWTLERAKSKIQMYWDIALYRFDEIKAMDKDLRKISIAVALFVVALAMKALPNVSACIRWVIEGIFDAHIDTLRIFEMYSNRYFWIPLIVAAAMIAMVLRSIKSPVTVIRNMLNMAFRVLHIDIEIRQRESQQITLKSFCPVLDVKDTKNLEKFIEDNSDITSLSDLLRVLSKWKYKKNFKEAHYNDRIMTLLSRKLRVYDSQSEVVVCDETDRKYRFDVVFNENIVLELKCSYNSSDIDRAKGQLDKYTDLIGEDLLILLLIDYNYNDAVINFSSYIEKLQKSGKQVFAAVV